MTRSRAPARTTRRRAAAAIALADTDNAFAEVRQRLRVLEWAVGANTVMLIGLVLKVIVFG